MKGMLFLFQMPTVSCLLRISMCSFYDASTFQNQLKTSIVLACVPGP